MRSPFPGMDPYLEAHWPGVHTQLVSLATAELNGKLPDDLVARPEERLAVESYEEADHNVVPDVVVTQPKRSDAIEGGIAISAPYRLEVEDEPLTERYIRVLRADDGRLISVIEFVSPANKTGEGLVAYRRKREELLSGGVHVVEIDLIRRGDWRGLLRPHRCPPELVTPYRVTLRLGAGRVAYLYPIPLEKPLPDVSIPLRPGDAEVRLELQPLLDQTYTNGRYGRTLDYTSSPEPPLSGAEAQWAASILSA